MRNRIPLARGLGSSAAATVGGLVAGNALLGEPLTTARPAPPGDRDRGSPGQRRSRAARRVRGDGRDRRRRSRRSASTRRATSGPSCSSPSCASMTKTCASPARQGPARRRGRQPRAGGDRGRGLRDRPLRPPPGADGRPPPRALPRGRLSRSCRASSRRRGTRVRWGPASRAPGRPSSRSSDSVSAIARIEAGFSAAAADTDLPGRILVVSPRNTGAQVVSRG